MAKLELHLMGTFNVLCGGKPLSGFESTKVKALLAHLALEHQRPRARETLAGLFWPEQSDEQARKNLRQAISNLRKTLGDTDSANPFLTITPAALQLRASENIWVDAVELDAHIEHCKRHRHRRLETCPACMRRMERVVTLYQGEFLQGLFVSGCQAFEDWQLILRERFHQHVFGALLGLTNHYERLENFEQAIHYAYQQVALDPWREEAHRQLMRLLVAKGQRSAALRQYETCRKVLVEAFGLEPAAETTALYEAARSGVHVTFRSPHQQHNLPAELTNFVGREQELDLIEELLVNPDTRLLTLIGPGGIGKTRLALEATRRVTQNFEHGVFFIPLAGLSTSRFILPTVADILGIPTSPTQDQNTQVKNYLRQREILLILDNFEHLLDGADWLNEMLKEAPELVIVVTSREPLHLQVERRFEVGGLAGPPEGVRTLSEALDYAAARLFVERAGRVRRGFQIEAEELPWLAAICRLVEGMPLALELAAPWVLHHSLAEIANRITHSLEILASPMRDLPPRHRSIRAAFEHSWQMLSAAEQQVFQRCAIFRGAFSLAAAIHIAEADSATLAALCIRSLLREIGSGRYSLHELLRQFGEERLIASGEVISIRQKHALFFADLLHAQETALQSSGRAAALKSLAVEAENFFQAWEWVARQQQTPERSHLLQQMLESLYQFLDAQGQWQNGAELLTLALPENGPARSALLVRLSLLHSRMIKLEQANQFLNESLTTAQEPDLALIYYAHSLVAHFGDQYDLAASQCLLALEHHPNPYLEAQIWNQLGQTYTLQGQPEKALQALETALARWQAVGIPAGISDTTSNLGEIYVDRGEYETANRLLQYSVSLCRDENDRPRLGYALARLGYALSMQQQTADAEACYLESLEIFSEIGHQGNVAVLYNRLANQITDRAQYSKAVAYYEKASDLLRGLNQSSTLGVTLANMGLTVFLLGDLPRAENLLQESLTLLQPTGRLWSIAHAQICLGHVYLKLNDEKRCLVNLNSGIQNALQAQAGPLYPDAAIVIAHLLVRQGRCPVSLLELTIHNPACSTDWQTEGAALLAQGKGLRTQPVFDMLEQALLTCLAMLGSG